MGKQKCGEKKGTANDPKHTASSVKHGGGGVMAWACMARTGRYEQKFISRYFLADLRYTVYISVGLHDYDKNHNCRLFP